MGLAEMGVDYVRISVTDRCNLRCVFCRPAGDCDFVRPNEILQIEEIHRTARLLAECGITKFRITGGEPLLRDDLAALIEKLKQVEAIKDLSLTTNGTLLEERVEEMKAAGLGRVNVNLPSMERQNYRKVTGFDCFDKVIGGIHRAIEAGLAPVKLNAVVLRGLNDDQVTALAAMSVQLPVVVRFVEYFATTPGTLPASDYVPNRTVRAMIEKRFGRLTQTVVGYGGGPASYLKIRDSAGSVGFIDSRSSVFCRTCNRLRLTSDGKVKPCLYAAPACDVKRLIRNGASDKEIGSTLRRVLAEKHLFTKLSCFNGGFCMRKVGG
jgi:cyclic pyranopterin phosphate synthase